MNRSGSQNNHQQRAGSVASYAAAVIWLFFSWWLFMAFHESGHVLSALVNGGRIEKVELHPLTVSQTIATGSAHPLMDVWMGAVAGSALPFLIYFISLRACPAVRRPAGYLAGFCAIANGLYIGLSWLYPGHADAHEMLRLGAHPASLIAFGLIAVGAGLYTWHREVIHYRESTPGVAS